MTYPNFEVTRVTMTAEEDVQGSAKLDGADGTLKRGIQVFWPNITAKAPLIKNASGGYRPQSMNQERVTVWSLYDKAAARVIDPLAKGKNIKKVTITETGRANNAEEVALRIFTMSNVFLEVIKYVYDHRIIEHLSPGGFLAMTFCAATTDLVHKEFDDQLNPTGQNNAGVSTEHGVAT